MSTSVIQVLNILEIVLPKVISMYEHYINIVKNGKYTIEDKEKAKTILENLKWKTFEEIKKEYEKSKKGV